METLEYHSAVTMQIETGYLFNPNFLLDSWKYMTICKVNRNQAS